MPVQNVNINNVSMDYFLRGVDAAKPKNAPEVPQEAQAGANAVVAPELEAAGKMVSQLDVLLMKAAKTSTKSLSGKQVEKKLQKLVSDGALSADSLKLLAKTADTAAKKLKELDKFTGKQLKDKGKVIEGAGWQDVQEVPVQTGKVPIQKWDGNVKNVGGDIANYAHLLTCPSYFARDELARFFG